MKKSFNNPSFENDIEGTISVGVAKMAQGDIGKPVTVPKDKSSVNKNRIMGFIQDAINTQCSTKNSSPVRLVGAFLFLLMSWVLIYLLLKEEVLPTGGLFKILVLLVISFVVGSLVSLISLPALLGMLITGIVLKTIHFFQVQGIYEEIISISRDVALTVILIKAGLGIDPVALKKHALNVLKLSLCPCIVEAVVAAVASHYIFGLPWLWGFLLGFLLSPISPAVVVPTLLSLKERGYGEDKGISTLVIAASSIDDIFSISAFGIFLSLIFNSQSDGLAMKIVHGPLELLLGFGIGILWGLICAVLPNKDDDSLTLKRSLMTGIGGLILVLGSKEIGFEGAGPLACVTSCFVASLCWTHQHSPNPVPSNVPGVFSAVWIVVQPVLFGLIGAEIDLNLLEIQNVLYSLSILAICLLARIITCIGVLFGSNLTWKECLFVNLAWLPKATVQAALGPQALEMVRLMKSNNPEDEWRANLLLTTAVLSILITAPLGSIGITLGGTRLLNKVDRVTDEEAN